MKEDILHTIGMIIMVSSPFTSLAVAGTITDDMLHTNNLTLYAFIWWASIIGILFIGWRMCEASKKEKARLEAISIKENRKAREEWYRKMED